MPLSPPHRRRALPTAVNHALANADQNLTEVDARLTGVDKGCQKLTASTPAPTPASSKTQRNRNRARHLDTSASTLAVNHSSTLRTNLNNPEQIRTNLNAAERPDQIGRPPESPLITPKKRNLNTVVAHSFPSFLPAQE